MATVAVRDGALHIELTVPERVLSLHGGSVAVPLTEIRDVRAVRDVLGQVRGIRMPGAGIAGVLAIGTWRGTVDGHTFHDFVVIKHAGPGLVITTAGRYDRLLIGADAPEAFAADLGLAN